MLIKTISVTPFEQNARLLIDEETGSSVLIDPGGEVDHILSQLEPEGKLIESIVLTHAHVDHAGGAKRLLETLGESTGDKPKLYAHEAGNLMRQSIEQQAALYGFPAGEFENVPEPDTYLADGEELSLWGKKAKILFTPGHAPGHICLYFENIPYRIMYIDRGGAQYQPELNAEGPLLIAGDTVFAGSIGRTDLPGGDHAQLMSSIAEKIMPLPDETLVLPGHGPDTTVGREREYNPFLQSML